MANGVSDGENANGYVTREQLATMLWRYAGEPASNYSLGAYTDADSVSSWAETAMRWAVENGIITGVTDSTPRTSGHRHPRPVRRNAHAVCGTVNPNTNKVHNGFGVFCCPFFDVEPRDIFPAREDLNPHASV